jgi:endo-1,3-1,4-beta-glycanase ExoK
LHISTLAGLLTRAFLFDRAELAQEDLPMKQPSHKAHNARLWAIVLFALALLFPVNRSLHSAAGGIMQGGLRVEVEEGKSARSTLTINNRCSVAHLFRIRSKPGFLHFEQDTDSVLIEAGSIKRLVVRLDATRLKSKTHRGNVVVECIDCKKEPGCSQNRDEVPVEMVVVESQLSATPPVSGSIRGRVMNPRNNPVVGVQVRAPGRAAVLTDGKGEFDIRGLPAAERLAVSFSAPGFMDTTGIYDSRRSSIGNTVVIWPRAAPASLDAERGGKLTFPGGTINFPPRALVDEAGRAVRGKVRVSFSALDVSDRRQVRSAPGDFTARMRDNKIRQLETFGVFEVFVEAANGRRANLARGRKASVELFIPRALRRRVPAAVGLFSFDQNSGLWVEEGTLEIAPDLTLFATNINSLTPVWNADMVLDTTCIKLKILDCDCHLPPVIPGSRVEATGLDYSGFSKGNTDTQGEICLPVKRNATVSVIAYHPSNSNIHSNPLEITTPTHVANASDCGNPSLCPLVATTHLANAGFFDGLNAHDTSLWCLSHGWANVGDPAFNVGWRADHIDFTTTPGKMLLALNDYADNPNNPCCMTTSNPCSIIGNDCSDMPFAAGQYRTKCFYGYGTYEATFKTGAPRGSGFITTFFTYTDDYDGTYDGSNPWHDEIDIEILSRAPNHQQYPQDPPTCQATDTLMQTNYFVKGVGGNEELYCLKFDASTTEHTYRFVWSATEIKWYVDPIGTNPTPVRTVTRVGNAPWPSQPGRIHVNLWAGRSPAADNWLGPFTYPGTPIYAEFNSIQHIPQP